MKSYSQFGQDLAVEEMLPGDRGVYVDVGASDGLFLSNTLRFEEKGWAGLCVEPDPDEFHRLLENRTCICENVACANFRGQLDFQRLPVRGWSGLVDFPHEYNAEKIAGLEREILSVRVLPLQDLLDKYQLMKVDYLSIDVEGAELAVLESVDWERMEIRAITVEISSDPSPIPGYLLCRGYALWGVLGSDHLYVLKRWLHDPDTQLLRAM